MESNSIADGIENLCLSEELRLVVASKLGAIPKISPKKSPPPEMPPIKVPHLVAPLTPAGLKRQQRKKNRKDRRRSGNEEEETLAKPMSKVEKLRAQGVQRSNSDQAIIENRLPSASSDEVTELIFKSQSSINVSTGIRNLPESFFSDELPEEVKAREEREKLDAKDNKKKRKGKKRAKQASTEEEDKKSSDKENTFYELNEKITDEDVGEEIVTTVGDEQTVSRKYCAEIGQSKYFKNLMPTFLQTEGCENLTKAWKEYCKSAKGWDVPEYNWRNVTRNGDIKKCILVDGVKEGGRPKQGDVVLVKSQGKLKDGTMIDDYPTLVFRVGEYEVIEGLDLVVQSMYKNELAIISIKPNLAYGDLGRKPDIPPEARITYLFGLLHFEKQKDMSEMTWAQRRKMGQSRMRIANWWYSRKEYPIAVKCYKKALQFYNNIPTNQECSTPDEYKELLTLMEERLRVMRQVANIFKRIANLIQSGQIET
eukprot:GFUD01003054.1.p1 GENE.GFUD01003054.1~~GFUD01003054.1.p1  ORF type:complete len:504 (+),score=156.30 GFUD01003054.1:68-1513(+)